MSIRDNQPHPVLGREVNPPKARRPYQKPEVRSERVFETSALQCGKTEPSQLQCKTSRKLS